MWTSFEDIKMWRCSSKVVFLPPNPLYSLKPNPGEWTVFLGQPLVNASKEFVMSFAVVNITVSNMTGSNIALLQLAESVSYRDDIQPVCVDFNNDRYFHVGSRCWLVGRGKGSSGKVLLGFCVCFVDK